MSIMLATTNPEAAASTGKIDLPPVGEWVVYHFRPGEIIAGMMRAPALVLARDPENSVLRLMVVRDVGDMIREDRVPRRRGQERGWDYIEDDMGPEHDAPPAVLKGTMEFIAAATARADAAHERLEAFMGELSDVFFGEQAKPTIALLDQFEALKARIAALETAATGTARAAKRPRNPTEV